ncbi:Nn.00g065540.m01.CDS01 [Neocucurbitaria sp. VM-36]
MNDKKAWDDSLLIRSWDDAVTEYKKYHSIHKSGEKLEDALTEEELRDLRSDYGDLLDKAETESGAADPNDDADLEDTDMSLLDANGYDHVAQAETQQQEPKTSEQQQQDQSVAAENPVPHDGNLAASMPQAILGTGSYPSYPLQDENLKNIMMSWYYAGYYTGLHAGQQQVAKDAPPKQ